MKNPLKDFFFLSVLVVLISAFSCSRPPELPDTPSISFHDIEFEVINEGDPLFEENVLRLSFNVADGNGDLGLDGGEDNPPYNAYNLIFDNTGNPVEFGQRPNDPMFTCLDYIIEERENTDVNNDGDFLDTLLIDFNYDQFNIEIDFFVKRNGQFQEVDLRAQPTGSANQNTLCGISFDGRFPCLSSTEDPCDYVRNNNRPIEGVITYDMISGLFEPIFRTDTLKLSFKIKDRALNESNISETPEFTLQEIKKVSTDEDED